MCSFSWRELGDSIIVAFNRDESVTRAKAEPPAIFGNAPLQYIMPVDPDAGGSWICVNQAGLVFALLNNYQARVKTASSELISRGQIIKNLAQSQSYLDAKAYLDELELEWFQPFTLVLVSARDKAMWQYDGVVESLLETTLPEQYFSSGHPEANRVLQEREQVAKQWQVSSEQDLIALHKSHQANNSKTEFEDRTFSICMHHSKGHTQSLSVIKLSGKQARFRYYDGQPCQTDLFAETLLALVP